MRFFILLALLGLSAVSAALAQTTAQRLVRYRYYEANPDSLRRVLATQRTDTARLRLLQHLGDGDNFASPAEERAEHGELARLAHRLRRPEAPAYRLYAAGLTLAEAKAPPAQQLDTARAALAAFDRLGRPAPGVLDLIGGLLGLLEPPEARRAFYQAKAAYYRRREMPQNLYVCYRMLGGYYTSRGDYNQGISYILRAADQGRAYNRYHQFNELGVAGSYYAEWGNPAKALHYLRQGLALQHALPHLNGYTWDAYPNWAIAQAYRQLGDYPAALRHANLSMVDTPTDTTRSYAALVPRVQAYGRVVKSAVLLDLGRVAEAGPLLAYAQHLADSLHLGLKNPSLRYMELDATWARYYAARGEPARAETAWLAAYGQARATKVVPLRLAYLRALADFYAQQGQTAPAGRYARTALALSDSLGARQGAFHVAQYEAEQATEAQNARIAALRETQLLEAARARRQRLLLGVTLAGLALLAGLGFVLWRSNRLKQRANDQLNRLHAAVTAQKGELEAQRDQLDASLTDLRATQAQLIQKEKMASLGELTAGIAHEIQNPLNFVNNFSEVSAELCEEARELLAATSLPAPEKEELTELLADLGQNQAKISQHGQRAAGIVRGMLEHSRTSAGERAPTDLNRLCEEYLRLAYQGLRVKDNSFHPELTTDLAPDLPLVSVVSGDVGRVLLNLFSNAFYAVQQRQQTGEDGYRPTVSLTTARVNGHVKIRVGDNGTGMSEAVQAKIFQPFFTTKPTGEGTGLGLSLSHDIIAQGHGGSLTVDSQEGQGTTIHVGLPLSGPA
ncbi:hypothetical protein AUC43_17350 [Hymenobacter sedentarius]|uniref:histidine kinase n=1 Tax=Hymenobacter sedentarius TaxID=1411621 RepID=A0A0U4C6W1_9BACT|nr:ATP-binding protein [Hymenobacter sedentarius]ALW86690.1 hypothetical protein AUC43_17350 [Hymenobacter sedentarius]